jgi:hypothetical protein
MIYVRPITISLGGLAIIAAIAIAATFIYCGARNISGDHRGDASEEIGAATLEAEEGRRPDGRADSWRIRGGDEWVEDFLRRQRKADREWDSHERRGLVSRDREAEAEQQVRD